jgi:carboxypeptidase N regulatory subunit
VADVQSLGISNANVTFIPDLTLVTKQFPNFKRLYIERSGLKHVERKKLATVPQVTLLNLAENRIEHLPENVFIDLVNLQTLDVSENEIKVLPPKLLWNLPNLKEFWAGENQIELIPRDFFKNNRELEILLINDNKITRIEVSFTLLPKLNHLNLDGNTCISEDCYGCNIEKLQQKIDRNCAAII